MEKNMIKDYFINEIENAIELAIKDNKLGAMTEYGKGTLKVERPKNADFGDYAVNVSSLARFAKIAPPQIANSILEYINKEDNEYDRTLDFSEIGIEGKVKVRDLWKHQDEGEAEASLSYKIPGRSCKIVRLTKSE